MLARIKAAVEFIRNNTSFEPETGIILGTGLGKLADEIDIVDTVNYSEIPDFPVSTVESHKGRFIFGNLSGKKVVAMQGRFHYYEGYTMPEVVLPVRVMKMLGIKNLLVSNASGALTPGLHSGDLVIIKDHINLQPENPLVGKNISELGPRFPDMSNAYDNDLRHKVMDIGKELNMDIKTGVYVSVPGPMLETQAEYRYLRLIGGDIVGMSTVPEIIAARHMGIPCLAISVVTDEGWHDVLEPITLEQVIAAASRAEPSLAMVLKELVKRLD
jgi:purine-nucleoside phosphorylase